MTDLELVRRLTKLTFVLTPVQHVRNRIVRIDRDAVIVVSDRTGRRRTIPFRDLRSAPNVTRNGVVVRALAAAVGV